MKNPRTGAIRGKIFYALTIILLISLFIPPSSAQAQVVPPPNLNPLNQTPVPEPPNLFQYVTNKQAAIQLGKAFFWDMQAGSDGIVACATCHFSAGADNRMKNTLNPGTRGGDTVFGNPSSVLAGVPGFQFGPNYTLDPINDFPFHQRAGIGHLQTDAILKDTNDVVGSQGVRKADFVDIVPGQAEETVTPVPDLIFNVGGINVRQVTARNSPTVINAVYNFTNFWDGRAHFIFNGENPFGPADQNAGVWFNIPGQGLVKQPVRLLFASLASQATGPPLDDVEMSARGRTFPQLGRKLLSLTPLGKQLVSHDDSVLGGLAASAATPGAKGLHTGYAEMIRDAFHDDLWNSPDPVTITLPGGQQAQFTQMEANFAFFWGVAIQLYEATLISEQTPFDHWLGGDDTAMTEQQKQGFALFSGVGKCTLCHIGIETTTASYTAAAFVNDFSHALIEQMFVADGTQVIYDNGFNNTAVRPTTEDIGRGGTAPFTNPLTGQPYPLSYSRLGELQAQAKLPYATPIMPQHLPPTFPVNANGAIKVPGLRNVELTTPYFHDGSTRSLDDVLDLYIRGGNFPTQNFHDLDPDIAGGLSSVLNDQVQEHAVIEFMKSLTDPRVAAESAPFDHPELFIPEGDPEVLRHIPARNMYGTAILPAVAVNAVNTPTRLAAQTVSGTMKAGLTPDVTVNTTATVGTVTVNGTQWSAPISGLVEGDNIVTASVLDGAVLETETTTITLDTAPPDLTIYPVTTPTPLNSQAVYGTVEVGAGVRVSINSTASAPAVVTGTDWSYVATLRNGLNSVSVTATDAAGNTLVQMATITVNLPPPPTNFTASLSGGWSLLSTPMKLNAGASTLDQVFDAPSLANIQAIVAWSGGLWVPVTGTYELLPLNALYLKVATATTVTATLVPSADISAPPSRNLTAGLNLVGPAPSWENNQYAAKPLDQTLLSIAQAPGGLNGYTMVISPAHNQAGWTHTRGGQVQNLLPFKGYWVIMDNPDTLFGSSTTPLVP